MENRRRSTGRAPVPADIAAIDVKVAGAVQGVGFRPFVHTLATRLALAGDARNTAAGVEIHVEGPVADLRSFVALLADEAPPLALVEDLSWTEADPRGLSGFVIAPSDCRSRADTLVTADAATCGDCLRELFDPNDRRYRYPFTNCTNCGPRFTITRAVPYDRPHTTMAPFRMCPECEREYHDPADRRFHAQPNACPACGPQVGFAAPASATPSLPGEAALAAAAELIRSGGVLALKGLGGYHLVCDATDESAVRRLRSRKRRDEKPFAVMAPSVDTVLRYCELSPGEQSLLTSPSRPVVLLERRAGGPALASEVAPGVSTYGLFLPYTPLHHLLLHDTDLPLVMTSGNLSDEPIAYEDADAFSRLAPLVDAFLTYDRAIHIRTDDSVTCMFRSRPYVLRRARGYAPLPVGFSGCEQQILAVGGHLKNAFCLTRRERAFLSHHIGDLRNLESLRSLQEGVAHFMGLFGLEPEVVAHDLHPDYLSTAYAREFARERGLPTIPVQHHEAHIASVTADAGYDGAVVGVAFDGAGYGPDGTIWGGEFFVGRPGSLDRAAHLEPMALPGGDAAVREPWRLVVALLDRLRPQSEADPEADAWIAQVLAAIPGGAALSQDRPWPLVLQAARQGINTPLTSSAGRLFDVVSSLLGLRHQVAYEGQAAILLETEARRGFAGDLPGPGTTPRWENAAALPSSATNSSQALVLPVEPFGQAVLDDLARDTDLPVIAARFHHALATLTADVAAALASSRGLAAVALGGGVFQNLLFLELVTRRLEAHGLRVLRHRSVPTNDGGLCLGQAETAAALMRLGQGADR